MRAADKGHIEVVTMLLDRNASIEAVNNVSRNVAWLVLHYVLFLLLLLLL